VRPRPVFAEGSEEPVDQVRIQVAQGGVVQTQRPGALWMQVTDHDVGAGCQALHNVTAGIVPIIDRQALFIAVQGQKRRTVAALTWFQLSSPVAVQRFDLDNAGPQVAQEHGAERS
jgi:hypothetical protein